MTQLPIIAAAAAAIASIACGPASGHRTPTPVTPPPVVEAPSQVPVVPAEPAPAGRLTDNVRPVAYELEVEMDATKPGFRGRIAIDIALAAPASSVWLHARDLIITSAQLRVGDTTSPLGRLGAPPDSELLGYSFGRTITDKRARLEFVFEGRFGSATGAFRQQRAGQWYAFTDFEPIDARAAFPCFDDPRFKVPWTVSLVVPATHHGFSNTPQVRAEVIDAHRKRLHFAPTPPLPSYLVAYAAGPFEIIEGARAPVPQRIIAFKGSAARASLALTAMPPMLRQLEQYFATEVPFRKIDLIAVPRFNGAMENPGLITVAEHLLLPDLNTTDADGRLLSMIVIAHELAHLWFGDLVTMDYWNDLWMNEGFATWMSGKLVGQFQPALRKKLWEILDRDGAMRVDEALDARAIRQPIKSRRDIRAAFDAITYRKGAAVLNMFEAWIGEHAFRDAMRAYVRDHARATGTATDLLRALSKSAGRDVATSMRTFLDQSGIPLVSTELTCRDGKGMLGLSQSRYFPLGPANRASAKHHKTRWHIPVCVRTGPAKTDVTCTLLDKASTTVALPSCPAWIYPNANADGYYRFRMPVTGLAKAMASGVLGPRERLDLVLNVDAMMRSGELPIEDVLTAVETLARTADQRQLTAIADTLTLLARSSVADADRPRFARLVQRIAGKRARAVGVSLRTTDTEDDVLLRPPLVALAGIHGQDAHLRRAATRVLTTWIKGGPMPTPELAVPVARVAGSALTTALRTRLVRALIAETVPARRAVLIEALASSGNRKHVRDMVSLALAPKPLGTNEALRAIRRLLQSPNTRDAAWAILRTQGAALESRVPSRFRQYLPLLARGLCRRAHATELRSFFDDLLRASSDFTEKAARSVGDCARLGDNYRAPLSRQLRRR